MIKIVTIVGARPQFVKAAAVSRACAEHGGIEELIVHTGQHFDPGMSDIFFDELGIPEPRHSLNVHGGGHGDMTGRMLIGLEPILLAERPDAILIYGDTNSTLAGALVAAKLHVPILHVEAGLRSFNRKMPEEINRIVSDHLSRMLLCPTRAAVENLKAEGITKNVHWVGDVMYDATLYAIERARAESIILARLGLECGKYDLATVHRAENTDDPARLAEIAEWLSIRARQRPLVLPMHPRTREALARTGIALSGVRIIDPVGYLDMTELMANCAEIYTDSGGVQKEAYFHRKLCTTLRDETEWIETVEAGWNVLWKHERAPLVEVTDYGHGDASQKIVRLVSAMRR